MIHLTSEQVAAVAQVAAQRAVLEDARKRLVEANGGAIYEVRGTVGGTTSPVGDVSLAELLLVFDARLSANAEVLASLGITVNDAAVAAEVQP
jgi:hypothetical protein